MADMAMETSVSEAARHYGVAIGTVSNALSEFGHRNSGDVPRLGRRSREGQNLRFVILKELLRGERQVDVANAHNVTRAYVHVLAKEAREAGFDIPEGGQLLPATTGSRASFPRKHASLSYHSCYPENMHHCPECEKHLARIEKLEHRLRFLESKPALKAGFTGERLISRLVDGIPTAFSTPHDVTTIREGMLIEVKFSNLNVAVKGSRTKRWTWHDPFGKKGRKKYDRLILVGEANPDVNYGDQFTDPYVYFDVPFENVADLIQKGDMIQISTNPKTAWSRKSRLLFTEYHLSPSELNARYGLLSEMGTQSEN